MFKRFKSIAAAIMAVVMLMSICCTPAMATEQMPEINTTDEVVQDAEAIASNVQIEKNQFVHDPIYLTAGRAGSFLFRIEGTRKTVRHRLVGNSAATRGKTVVFRIRNTTTGATRSFTAVADYSENGGWLSDTYNTPIPEGEYEMWIVYVGANGSYGVTIYFE